MSESRVSFEEDRSGGLEPSEPSVHELLNDATVWLQYARGVTATLADLVHEAEGVDCKQLALSLEAVAAMMQAGTEQVGRAHARWTYESGLSR
jgi:hypothetical protein